MDNFIPLNGSPELQEEAVKQIANLPEYPLYELRFEWEKDVFLMAENYYFSSSLTSMTVLLKAKNEWISSFIIPREMLEDIEYLKEHIQNEIDCIKKSAE